MVAKVVTPAFTELVAISKKRPGYPYHLEGCANTWA